MGKSSVSFFDGSSHGDALREFCDFRRGNGRKNLRENGRKQAAGAALLNVGLVLSTPLVSCHALQVEEGEYMFHSRHLYNNSGLTL